MPRKEKKQKLPEAQDTSHPRNEDSPGQLSIGTSSPEELNAENSPDIRDALNESQL